MRRSIVCAALAAGALGGCPDAGIKRDQAPRPVAASASRPMTTQPASDGKLEIQLTIEPGMKRDRVPTRTATLRFKNVSGAPLRIYLPQGEPFRANISTLIFAPLGAAPLFVPEPRPHGYVVTEKDFPLIAAGAALRFTQRFTIDPVPPGPTHEPRRLAGFEPGKPVPLRWTYENAITRWQGGVGTLDGPTKELFGGEEIPFIWTGKLTVRGTWTAPPRE